MPSPLPQPHWWQLWLRGVLRTPQQIFRAATQGPDSRFFGMPDPTDAWTAPARLKDENHFLSASYMRQMDRADWNYTDPRLVVWAAMVQQAAKKRGIPLYVHSALRTRHEQNALVAKGVSKAKYPKSAHNTGEAVDLVHGTFHWDMTNDEWRLIHVLGNLALDRLNASLTREHKLQLTWGGNWSFYDPAHWEITDYRDRTRELPPMAKPLRYTPAGVMLQRDRLLRGL